MAWTSADGRPGRGGREAGARTGGAGARLALAAALSVFGLAASACGAGLSRPPAAERWFQRARAEFASADSEEARDAAMRALSISPDDPELRVFAARVSLSQLAYDEVLRLLRDVPGSQARALRGRAHWFKGDLEAAADELEVLLEDPEVRDPWAKAVSRLARTGVGRKPFAVSGALLAAVDMPRISQDAPYLVVPVDIDGESALALVATNNSEVVIDSAARGEPSWVSLRFGGRFEVADVPAVAQDLSAVSRQLNAPIRALLGVHLLRRLHVTVDYWGRQFVVRSFSPPAPPLASRLEPLYAKGSALVLPSTLGADKARGALLVDTALAWPLALDAGGWRKAGVDPASMAVVPQDPRKRIRQGTVPAVQLGGLDIAEVPGVSGIPMEDIEKMATIDVDGLVGAGLFAQFRITFADRGRTLWVEDDRATEALLSQPPAPGKGAPPPPLPGEEPLLPQMGPGLPGAPPAPAPPPRAPAPPAKPRAKG